MISSIAFHVGIMHMKPDISLETRSPAHLTLNNHKRTSNQTNLQPDRQEGEDKTGLPSHNHPNNILKPILPRFHNSRLTPLAPRLNIGPFFHQKPHNAHKPTPRRQNKRRPERPRQVHIRPGIDKHLDSIQMSRQGRSGQRAPAWSPTI